MMTSPITAESLLIQFDECRKIIKLLVPQRAGDLSTFSVLCEIANGECSTRQDLENRIGTAVLAYLSAAHTSSSFFLDEFREKGRMVKAEMVRESASLLASDDIDEQFEGVMLLISGFDKMWQVEDIEKVTALLRHIAEHGSEKAKKYLEEDWPELSRVFKIRLTRDR
jgi:hypothetical protein